MGERIGMRWGLWGLLERRAVYLPLAAPTLPRVPNSHCLLVPMPNAVRLHQVAPPRMCAVLSMPGCLCLVDPLTNAHLPVPVPPGPRLFQRQGVWLRFSD